MTDTSTQTASAKKIECTRATSSSAKRVTKKAQLIKMLSTKAGTELGTISDKLGWQIHTTRAALTGLRKEGCQIAAEKKSAEKPARYRITEKAGHCEAQPADVEIADAG